MSDLFVSVLLPCFGILVGWFVLCAFVGRSAVVAGIASIVMIAAVFLLQLLPAKQSIVDIQDVYTLMIVYLAFTYWYLFIKDNEDVTKGEIYSTVAGGFVAIALGRSVSLSRVVVLLMIVLGSMLARIAQRLFD